MKNYRRCALLLAALAIGACSKSADDAPKLPLGHPRVSSQDRSGERSGPTIHGEAKVALDSGNKLYTAKAYPLALAQYRRAATLAPDEEAPLFGMLMVANVTNDTRLADSVTTLLRARNGPATGRSSTLSGSELTDIHAGVTSIPRPPRPAKKP